MPAPLLKLGTTKVPHLLGFGFSRIRQSNSNFVGYRLAEVHLLVVIDKVEVDASSLMVDNGTYGKDQVLHMFVATLHCQCYVSA
jgi:hypothetical protein